MTSYTLNPVQSFRLEAERSTLLLDCGGPLLSITALHPRILRVRVAPQGEFAPRRPWAVNRPDEEFPPVAAVLSETENAVLLDTGVFRAAVDKASGRLAFLDPAGRVFCADATPPVFSEAGISLTKMIADAENFYGFGERTGLLEKSGRCLTNWATDPAIPHGEGIDPLYIAMPVYLSVQPGLAYSVFFNNTYFSRFDLRALTHLDFTAHGGDVDYYVFYGPTPAEAIQALTEVTGRMPLPPRWALGYHQSRWSYDTEGAVRSVAENFRSRDLPCDCIHLDIDYMRGYRVFTWDKTRFPDAKSLSDELLQQGFRIVTIIDPGVKVDEDYEVYREGLEKGYFVQTPEGKPARGFVWPDLSVWSDYTRPEVREWWGRLQERLTSQGVRGVWNDMNEPAVFQLPFSEGAGQVGTLPLDAVQGPEEARTTHAEVHNLYGYGMAQASYEGLRKLMPDERPFNLCRSGFAGIQRWTASWMGDNQSWWQHLEMSLPQLMNMGMSGVPFVGVDIGGFGDNAKPELFARWIQAGVLFPFYRGHSSIHTSQHEPWAFGPEVESVARRYLKLRYRLLPYLYSVFWEASRTGAPILRPLLYHFPDDPATYSLHDEAMLGPAILAAPVYQPGRTKRMVYLPEGDWFDLWSGDRLRGPVTFLADAPLDQLPLFVRGGSVLPIGPEMAYSDEKPVNPLLLEVYPGAGEFTLYEDDGISYGFERGEVALTRFRLEMDAEGQTIYIDEREGDYRVPEREVMLRIHGVARRPEGVDPQADFDAERQLLTIIFTDRGKAQRIRV